MSERNEPINFAARTWKNLLFIEKAVDDKPDARVAHKVTQLALSLLGLIVFQVEKNKAHLEEKTKNCPLAILAQRDWPVWNFQKDPSGRPPKKPDPPGTLFALVEWLRNTVAHGLITFSSDSPFYEEVDIRFDNTGKGWRWLVRKNQRCETTRLLPSLQKLSNTGLTRNNPRLLAEGLFSRVPLIRSPGHGRIFASLPDPDGTSSQRIRTPPPPAQSVGTPQCGYSNHGKNENCHRVHRAIVRDG